MSSMTRQAALVSALLLGACAAVPGAKLTDSKPISSYQTEQSFAATPAAWPGDRWWEAYGDPQLSALIDEGLAGAPDIAAAKGRLEKARAMVSSSRADLLPSLTGNAEVSSNKESLNLGFPPQFAQYLPHGYHGFGEATLNLNWELDFWGKNRKALAAAISDARASDADLAEARLVLSTSIAAAYADLARLYAERDVAERAVASRQETLDLVQRRVTNGLDTHGELSQAQAGPASARADLDAIDEEIVLTRNQIAALMGEGPDRGAGIARPKDASLKAFGLPQRLAADLLGRRPDIAAARWRAEAASKRIGVAKAQFYPDVNLVGLIGYQALGLGKLFEASSNVGQFGPAVSLPIFEGGRLRANLKGARADYQTAVASYDSTLTEALHQVADAAASERALGGRLQESSDALAADEDAYRIARLRYEGGLSNYQTVLLSEDTVLADRRTVADLRARAFTLDVQLVRALGGGYQTSVN
jgi:NodT family efflux transporter outer membrane factor (OMF) lipoprotein